MAYFFYRMSRSKEGRNLSVNGIDISAVCTYFLKLEAKRYPKAFGPFPYV
jgi:hypothetical protein